MAAASKIPETKTSVEQRQLAQRDRELDLKEREITRSPWSNPLIATLAAGVLALIGNIVVSSFNGKAQRDVEREKARGNLLLEAIKTGDVQAATCNLDFLVESGLLAANEYPELKAYTEKKATDCEGAVLPSPEAGRAVLPSCDTTKLPTPDVIASARADAEKAGTLSWMSIALGEVGVCENTDIGAQRISEYNASLGTKLPSNAINTFWSAVFVNWTFKSAGIQPQNSPAGYEWENWGVPAGRPVVGSLVIALRAGANDPNVRGPRHIGFYMGETDGRILVLGGNVGNQVSVSPIPKNRIVAYRNPPKQAGE